MTAESLEKNTAQERPRAHARRTRVDPVELLVNLLRGETETFQDPSGTPYISLLLSEQRGLRTVRLSNPAVKEWARLRLWDIYHLGVDDRTLAAALGIIAGQTARLGTTAPVYTRLAPAPASAPAPEGAGTDGLYLDLGSGTRAVRVTADGWDIVTTPPVKFQRPAGFQPLLRDGDEPQLGGGEGVAELRRFLNVGDAGDGDGDPEADDRFILLVAWLVGCFMPDGDYPVLVLNGQKGSAKTTTMRMLRALVDPHEAVENAAPETGEELLLQAAQTWVSSFDNLRSVKPWFSDALCRLATGSASGKRQLYTDDTRLITKVRRPAVLNGIPDLAKSDDLLERSLRVRLPALPSDKRALRSALEREFEAARPRLLGALLDAVAVALRDRAAVNARLTRRPRLADWYVWVLAAAGSGRLGFTPQQFAQTVQRHLSEGQRAALEANPVTDMLLLFMREQHANGPWTGTLHHLFEALTDFARKHTDVRTPHSDWPGSANGFRWRLHAAEADLAAVGLTIARRHDGIQRLLTLTYAPREPEPQVDVTVEDLTHLTHLNAPPNRCVKHAEPESKLGLTHPNAPFRSSFIETEKEEREEQRASDANALDALGGTPNPHDIRAEGVNASPVGSVRDALGALGNGSPPAPAPPAAACRVPACGQPVYAEMSRAGLCEDHLAETTPGYDWPPDACEHQVVEPQDDQWVCADCGIVWARREDIPAAAWVNDADCPDCGEAAA